MKDYMKWFKIFAVLALMAFMASFTPRGAEAQGGNAPSAVPSPAVVQVKKVINTYFRSLYEARKSLAPTNFSSIATAKGSRNPGWLTREQERQDIERVIAKTFNNPVIDYRFTLNYQSVQVNNDSAIAHLVESNTMLYSMTPTVPSKMSGLEHTITLRKVAGAWLISNDDYQDEMVQALNSMTKAEILKNIQKNHDAQYIKPPAVGQTPNRQIRPALTSYAYNVPAAENYADAYALNSTTSSPYYGYN